MDKGEVVMPSTAKKQPSAWSAGRILKPMLTAGMLMLAVGNAAAQDAHGFDHEGLPKQVLEQHIRPLHADLADKADKLRLTLTAACQSRGADDGNAIKTAFRDLVLAWSRTEHLRFGPVTDRNRFERVMYWPDRQRIGERQVSQILSKREPTATSAAELGKRSVAVQGLTALEVVLYGQGGSTILSETAEARFACGYATAIATGISAIAKEIVSEWADGASFTALWLEPGEQNPVYKASSDRTIELLKAYRVGIYNARDMKLLPSLGLKRIARRGQLAPKSRPPFELSALSLASMIANLEGVLDLYVKGGLAEQLAVRESETARLTKLDLESAIEAMRAIEPFGPAAFHDQAIMDRLALVRDPLSFALSEGGLALAEIAGMGALVLGFLDDDGD
jgi:predicted lipoprotein